MENKKTKNKNSNYAHTFFMLVFLAVLFSQLSFASVNPKLELLNYSVSESPSQPGHIIHLTLFIKSIYSDNCAENVAVQLVVSYPLSIQGSDKQYIDGLCSTDPDSKGTFYFDLPIDNLATSGTYSVSVLTTYEKRFTQLSESNTINLKVGGSPSFVASVTSSNPVDIYPGDDAQVTVTFQNTGPTMVQSSRASATSNGIEVKWAGSSQELGQISAHGSTSATFSVEAPKNLAAGSYPININLAYISEDKTQGSSQFSFTVPIKPKAEFSSAYTDPSPLLSGEQKEVQVQITNTGSEEARKLKIRIKPLFPFSTDGTVRYIDSLAPGKSASLTYVITVDKDATTGAQLSGLLVDYENPQGKKFSDTTDFSMPIRQSTLTDAAKQYWYMGALFVLLVIFVVARRMGIIGKKK